MSAPPGRLKLALQETAVHVAPGILRRTGELLRSHLPAQRVLLVSDRTVSRLHGQAVLESLRAAGLDGTAMVVASGERAKTMATVELICRRAARAGLERTDALVALGGGVVCDLTGFAAAAYLRGVAWVALPTTLLAQLDAALGGKTGVDLPEGKNLVGAFHHPSILAADPLALATLPAGELACGLAEAIKYGMIAQPGIITEIKRNAGKIAIKDSKTMQNLVTTCLEVKAGVVGRDPHERGERAILNYGHTLGHALEQVSGYRLPHGLAVARGMRGAAAVALERGWLGGDESADLDQVLRLAGAGQPPLRLRPAAVRAATRRDKKAQAGETLWVLAGPIGRVRYGERISRDELELAVSTALEGF